MLESCLSFLTSFDQHLLSFISSYGQFAYVVLFMIIFCETGLVITPFLPGDSLLFVAGTLAAKVDHLIHIEWLLMTLIVASVLGNQLNYHIGRFIGPRVFCFQNSWLFNKRYLQHAHDFYVRHGKVTIILARFLPIIRTFAPFVAGVAKMNLMFFTLYNAFSGLLWVAGLLLAGYYFGHLPFVKAHFLAFIYGIVFLSLLPSLWVGGRAYFHRA